jgi:hypothetical protein
VKELDWGQEGDDWISFVTINSAHLTPCTQKHTVGEIVITGGDWDAGYFGAVKENLVFLDAPDCANMGCPFGIYDPSTAKKVYEDQLRLNRNGKRTEILFLRSGGHLVMRYPRVVAAKCSLPQKKTECWKEILRTTGLAQQPIPKCFGYDGFNERTGFGTDDQSDPSVVSFQVEVSLPEFKTHNLAGPVACWAGE